MTIPATCCSCRRKFELDIPAPDPSRHCQYCGGDLSYGQPTAKAGAPAAIGQTTRQERAVCPVCGTDVFVQPVKPMACQRCGTELLSPEAPGSPARVAPRPAPANRPPFEMPCPHCGTRLAMPLERPQPEVKCSKCGRQLTTLYFPLEAWADVSTLDQPGTLSENLIFVLRTRWNSGKATAGEILRQVEGVRHVTQWLQAKPEARPSEFPLPPALTAEILKFFIMRTPQAHIQAQPDGHVLLVIPAEKQESERVAPALIVVAVPHSSGSTFEFQARAADGTIASLGDEQSSGVRSTIAGAAPRANFRYLAYRAIFGDWIRPRAIACVPPSILERELAGLAVPESRAKSLKERLAEESA